MGSMLRIVNGRVYDPANDVDGKVGDICIKDGKIVDEWTVYDELSLLVQIKLAQLADKASAVEAAEA